MLSSLPQASSFPSGLKATLLTEPLCNVDWGRPVGTSHSRTVPSPLAEASSVPSGLKATPYTASVWPRKLALD